VGRRLGCSNPEKSIGWRNVLISSLDGREIVGSVAHGRENEERLGAIAGTEYQRLVIGMRCKVGILEHAVAEWVIKSLTVRDLISHTTTKGYINLCNSNGHNELRNLPIGACGLRNGERVLPGVSVRVGQWPVLVKNEFPDSVQEMS
jgi:hypothetical protein